MLTLRKEEELIPGEQMLHTEVSDLLQAGVYPLVKKSPWSTNPPKSTRMVPRHAASSPRSSCPDGPGHKANTSRLMQIHEHKCENHDSHVIQLYAVMLQILRDRMNKQTIKNCTKTYSSYVCHRSRWFSFLYPDQRECGRTGVLTQGQKGTDGW